ncbi:MAG: penicillin-binding protein 2 [Gemmatimonadota bacterium]|nr:penicillin-binding protein 2 [Gemmatimonadota bacterium]
MRQPSRVGTIHLLLAAFVIALLVKTARVQLVDGKRFAASAARQQSTTSTTPAPRGEIFDSRGELLAQSRETVKLEIAPREIRDLHKLRLALVRAHIPAEWVARATDLSRKWVTLPSRYRAVDVASISAMRGVTSTPVIERAYAFAEGTRRIVGRVDADGNAVDGIELALDSLLKGKAGSTTMMKDVRGRRFDSPDAPATPAVQGNAVVLTINEELQEIAERELADAVSRMGAEGGDVVVMNPADGEVLAMASHRSNPLSTSSTALTEPYEPGSTMKPFMAALLLEHGLARETDVIPTHNGSFTINGRTITDEHPYPQLALSDVIRFSSNIGIVQFAERLQARQEYEGLRDFGFGTPTGVAYPVEASGTLRPPVKWSKQSANSLAMGYEVAVTPLQLVAAYVALANGGELLEPSLIKEVRAPDGTVLYRHQRRVVRRVVSQAVARRVRDMLLGVVEAGGTAKRADLGAFSLAGKTGTARRTVHGSYAAAEHIPTFVGLFPADNPQFVILVKIDNPKGDYMGGLTAAPVTKRVLEAALASRDASLDRRSLAASRHERLPDSTLHPLDLTVATQAVRDTAPHADTVALAIDDTIAPRTFTATLPLRAKAKPAVPPPRAVPDVHGFSLRQAVHALHAAGFRVQLDVKGTGETQPTAGSVLPVGSLVHLSGTP